MDRSKKPEPIIPDLLVRPRLQTLNPGRGRQKASPPGAEETEDPARGPRPDVGGSMAMRKREESVDPNCSHMSCRATHCVEIQMYGNIRF